MKVEYSDEELVELAELVEARILKKRRQLNQKPLTPEEFSEKSGLSTSQIYRWVKAGKLKKIPDLGKKILIPASEVERYQG